MSEEEKMEQELQALEEKYREILQEVNRAIRVEMRKVGTRKNVIVTKIYLPQKYIEALCEYRDFRILWEGKTLYRWIIDQSTKERRLVKYAPVPNLGGIPVVLGDEVRAEVIKIPKRKRSK